MIISPGRSYIFVHIPKTGGTSIATALETRAMKDDILVGDTPKASRRAARQKALPAKGRLWKHATLADIEGIVTGDAFTRYFVFTLVRNPWDRMVSYYHWLRAQRFAHPAVTLAQEVGFSAFLQDAATQAGLRDWPYARYVTTDAGQERCDAFVRVEHLAEDLAPVESHLGFDLGDIPHLNRSDRPMDYREAYSDADARLIAGLCAADIVRFGYTF